MEKKSVLRGMALVGAVLAMAISAEAGSRVSADSLLLGEPYLQDPRPEAMTVMFQTRPVCHTWVEYGTDTLQLRRARTLLDGQEVCFDIENRITLPDLQPATDYFYRVVAVEMLRKEAYDTQLGDTAATRFYHFRTPPVGPSDFRCLIFNDLHQNEDAMRAAMAAVKDVEADLVIFNGDCLPEPADRQHAIRLIHRLADSIGAAERPVLFLRGNHEIRNNYSAGMHSLIGYPDDRTYGALQWGDTRLVMLDCGEDKPDTTEVYAGLNDFTALRQAQWEFLLRELASEEFLNSPHRVLISHIPVFGNVDDYKPCLELWGPLLRQAPFELAIGAHNHRALYAPQGIDGCEYPVFIGGGPSPQKYTVALLETRDGKLHLRVISPDPQAALDTTF